MCTERKQLVDQYKVELESISIPSEALQLIKVIGEGKALCSLYKHVLITVKLINQQVLLEWYFRVFTVILKLIIKWK